MSYDFNDAGPQSETAERYEVPLTAAAVMSKLFKPVEPMTAVPPENVGITPMEEL